MLSEHVIREAKPGPKPYFMWDQRIGGLGVKVNVSGKKLYVLQYRTPDRKSHRVTLAKCAELSLRDARDRAAADLVKVRNGEDDPATRRAALREAPTVADLWKTFEEEYAPVRIANGRLTRRTAMSYRRLMTKYVLPVIGTVPVNEVKRADVQEVVGQVVGKKAQYNRLLAAISRLFTLAEYLELRPQHTNPVRGIERAREEARDRVLEASELAALASALKAWEDRAPATVAAIRVAVVTGLRFGSEILPMRWENIAFEAGRLTMPETKTGRRGHDLPSVALEIIAEQPRVNEWVWTGPRGARLHYDGCRALFSKIREDAGLPDVRLHDLRRTVMTTAARSGIGTHTLRDLLGHKTTQQADRYIRSIGDPVRDAREQVGTTMAAMMEGKSADIVPLNRSQAS